MTLIPGKLYQTKRDFIIDDGERGRFLMKQGATLLLLEQRQFLSKKDTFIVMSTKFLHLSKEVDVTFSVYHYEDLYKHIHCFIDQIGV